MIKFIFKWFGLAKQAFSVYRVLFIVGGVVIGFVSIQQFRINSKTKKISRLKITIQELQQENKTCHEANQANQANIKHVKALHQGCIDKFTDAEKDNDVAIIEVKAKQHENEIKTKILKERVIVNTCIIDPANIELLKQANNQD